MEVLFTGDTMNFYLDGGPQRIQGMESWPDDVLPQLLDLNRRRRPRHVHPVLCQNSALSK